MSGNQEPTFRVCPDYSRSLGDAAFEFGKSFGITLDPWQRGVMDDWLALGDDGKWVAGTCGLSVPRQNGKTALVKVRVMLGIFSLGETVLFTCHEVRTSRQVFDSLAEILNPMGEYPDLAAQVQYVKRSNGYEEIKVADWMDDDGTWHRGGKLLFSSRSKGASRGFTADVVVADESMYMTDEQVAALVPTMASASGGDMQFIMLGTPPSPGDNGTVFKATRDSAIAGAAGVAWSEWSVDEIGDTTDWSRVERCNPSFGTRLMRKAVENEMAVMAPDTFARERLGWWLPPESDASSPVSAAKWAKCETDSPPMDGVTVLACKFEPGSGTGSICAAVKPSGGKPHVEYVETHTIADGLGWFARALAEAPNVAEYAIDGGSRADELHRLMVEAGVPKTAIRRPKSWEVSAACAALVSDVDGCAMTHYGQRELTDAVTKCRERSIGRDGIGFESTDGGSAEIAECAAIALRTAKTTKRNPNRKMRMG